VQAFEFLWSSGIAIAAVTTRARPGLAAALAEIDRDLPKLVASPPSQG
jgi:hypothetical protein